MNLKNKLMKKAVLLMVATTVIGSNGVIAHAQTPVDEVGAAYEWSEVDESEVAEISTYSSLPVWTLRDDKDVAVDAGTINLKSYTMVLLNDTKLCKGVTVHKSKFEGFVRARFETIFGEVHEGSDSMRVISYYGDKAETPGSDVGGWNGIAHTYCNSL